MFELPSFFEGLSKAFIGYKALFCPAFFFQIRKHVSDAMCEYDFTWMKCLCIRFTFMIFSFIKITTFSAMHTLQACWCSLFLLFLKRYFCLDARPSHRILFFVLENKNHSCSSLYIWNTGLFVFMFWTLQLSRCQ